MSAGAAIGVPAASCFVVDAGTLVVAGALQSGGARKTVRIRARSASACAPPAVPIAAGIGRPIRRAVATWRAIRVFMVRPLWRTAPAWIALHAASGTHRNIAPFLASATSIRRARSSPTSTPSSIVSSGSRRSRSSARCGRSWPSQRSPSARRARSAIAAEGFQRILQDQQAHARLSDPGEAFENAEAAFHGLERHTDIARFLSDVQIVDRHKHTGTWTFLLGHSHQVVSDRSCLINRPPQGQIRGIDNIFRIMPLRPGPALYASGIVSSVNKEPAKIATDLL